MTQPIVITNDVFTLNYHVMANLLGVESFSEWRDTIERQTAEELKIEEELLGHSIDNLFVIQLTTFNMASPPKLRNLVKRFFGPVPNQKDTNDLLIWLNDFVRTISKEVLAAILTYCIQKSVILRSDQPRPQYVQWRQVLEEWMSQSHRPGICMYPNCHLLLLKVQCSSCAALFCNKVHMQSALEKGYHQHNCIKSEV